MLMGAIEATVPCAADGEGSVRMMLCRGRYPYPAGLVDEVVEALVSVALFASDPEGFRRAAVRAPFASRSEGDHDRAGDP